VTRYSRAAVAEINFHKAVIRELANLTGASVEQIVSAVKRAKAAPHAQAIEARRAETQSGSVHESAVAESDAP
jgi:hypothetical protein